MDSVIIAYDFIQKRELKERNRIEQTHLIAEGYKNRVCRDLEIMARARPYSNEAQSALFGEILHHVQTRRQHPKQKEQIGDYMPTYKQEIYKVCFNHQLMRSTLVGQCFLHLMREDQEALSKQFCSVML